MSDWRRLAQVAFLLTAFPVAAMAQQCRHLKRPNHARFPEGQAGAADMRSSKRVWAPKRHVAVPDGPLDTVHISLNRTECRGACPSYSIELNGDGSATYVGRAFVLVAGRHSFKVPNDDVRCLLSQFKKADFWSLAKEYSADITDGTQDTVTLKVSGQTKTVVDYFGVEAGMPNTVTALEKEIDRIGADRWVKGTSETFPTLQAEHFDFQSQAAASILAYGAEEAPDSLIYSMIAAGTPVTGRRIMFGRQGAAAVVLASYAGRTTIVQSLIANGAFDTEQPDVKEDALRAAAGSGVPDVVAEILKQRPDVNAQDRSDGNTALIEMWHSQTHSRHPKNTDIVGVAHVLLKAGADPKVANKEGDTALFSASNAEVVRLLLKAGAKIDIRDKNGDTPLLTARNDETAVALIEAGADTTVRNRSGETIRKKAKDSAFTETLRLLRGKP